jgi:glutamate decarboxylase
MALHKHAPHEQRDAVVAVRPQFIDAGEEIPRFLMPHQGLAPANAYQIIHDELLLDGVARLNLATFVTTWMEPEAERLMSECASKNMIDKDEYPQTAELERRCTAMIGHLWHAPVAEDATGCSTTGSSEACMLGGMALKWRWRKRREAEGKPADKPNLVMGSNVQVCWEKFCRYWEVEPRMVPVGPDHTHLTAEGAVAACDENTIGVVAILGSTYDGAYEPVSEIASSLDALAAGGGPDIPMHIDAASGGFVAPFVDPELEWDFRVPRVQSINSSGHKYGLVYPGVGWIVWRNEEALPRELVFDVDYLGGNMPTFALNFSRPGAQVVAQYYMFLRLGREGYKRVQEACSMTANWIAAEVTAMPQFTVISGQPNLPGLPVVAFRMSDGHQAGYTVYDVSEALRAKGWLVPAYPMPENLQDMSVLRIVVRNGLSRDMAHLLIADLKWAVNRLESGGAPKLADDDPEKAAGFHH